MVYISDQAQRAVHGRALLDLSAEGLFEVLHPAVDLVGGEVVVVDGDLYAASGLRFHHQLQSPNTP
jgi:hypothetical protein